MTNMKIKFWGVRGSIASPSKDALKLGGNTSCVEILGLPEIFILDAGTGIKNLGDKLKKGQKKTIHLFLSHFHIDHICGLPFFSPLYDKSFEIHIYGNAKTSSALKKKIAPLFHQDYFPVPFKNLPARIIFYGIHEQSFKVKSTQVQTCLLNHPEEVLGYSFVFKKQKFVYMTDCEPSESCWHLKKSLKKKYDQKIISFANGADILIHDAHYFSSEMKKFKGWGHSDWNYCLRFKKATQSKKLYLFHHDPEKKDSLILKRFQKLQDKDVFLAKEQ